MAEKLPQYRVNYDLIQGFWASKESGAVTVRFDTRPLDDTHDMDARIYEAVFEAVKHRITSAKYRLIVGAYTELKGNPVLDSVDYIAQVKK